MPASNEEFWAKLDHLGAAQVRMNLATNVYLGAEGSLAKAWLERRNEASSAEQLALARRASFDAHKANKIATIALAMAIISTIVSIAGLGTGIFLSH
jgi:hypothetical protein